MSERVESLAVIRVSPRASLVGRVGALAVALGVGSAVGAMPVAFADNTADSLLRLAKDKTEQLYLATIPAALPDLRSRIRVKNKTAS